MAGIELSHEVMLGDILNLTIAALQYDKRRRRSRASVWVDNLEA